MLREGAVPNSPFSLYADGQRFASLIAMLSTTSGQLTIFNLSIATFALVLHLLQLVVFGKLRAIEWQRLWERLASYAMGQLVVLGAVVEPDLAELAFWSGFATIVGFLGLYSGLTRDRLEYMAHLPELPSLLSFAPVVCLALLILLLSVVLLAVSAALLIEASYSTIILFLFPCWLVSADAVHGLIHIYLQRRERLLGTTDSLYYVSLIPELGMQTCKLFHHVHVWYVHLSLIHI